MRGIEKQRRKMNSEFYISTPSTGNYHVSIVREIVLTTTEAVYFHSIPIYFGLFKLIFLPLNACNRTMFSMKSFQRARVLEFRHFLFRNRITIFVYCRKNIMLNKGNRIEYGLNFKLIADDGLPIKTSKNENATLKQSREN